MKVKLLGASLTGRYLLLKTDQGDFKISNFATDRNNQKINEELHRRPDGLKSALRTFTSLKGKDINIEIHSNGGWIKKFPDYSVEELIEGKQDKNEEYVEEKYIEETDWQEELQEQESMNTNEANETTVAKVADTQDNGGNKQETIQQKMLQEAIRHDSGALQYGTETVLQALQYGRADELYNAVMQSFESKIRAKGAPMTPATRLALLQTTFAGYVNIVQRMIFETASIYEYAMERGTDRAKDLASEKFNKIIQQFDAYVNQLGKHVKSNKEQRHTDGVTLSR